MPPRPSRLARLAAEHARYRRSPGSWVKSPGISPYRPGGRRANRRWLPSAAPPCGSPEACRRHHGAHHLRHRHQGQEHHRPRCSRTCCARQTLRTALAGNIGDAVAGTARRRPMPGRSSCPATRPATWPPPARARRWPSSPIPSRHLDWHGGQQRYVEDKLALVTGGRRGSRCSTPRPGAGRCDCRTARSAGTGSRGLAPARRRPASRGDAGDGHRDVLPWSPQPQQPARCEDRAGGDRPGCGRALAPSCGAFSHCRIACSPLGERDGSYRQRFDQHHAAWRPGGWRI